MRLSCCFTLGPRLFLCLLPLCLLGLPLLAQASHGSVPCPPLLSPDLNHNSAHPCSRSTNPLSRGPLQLASPESVSNLIYLLLDKLPLSPHLVPTQCFPIPAIPLASTLLLKPETWGFSSTTPILTDDSSSSSRLPPCSLGKRESWTEADTKKPGRE